MISGIEVILIIRRWRNNAVVVLLTLSDWISGPIWIPMPFIAICFVAQNHCVMVQLIVPTCVYALLAYISPSQSSWLRIHRATLMLLGNFSSFWTRYCVLLLYVVDYFGTKSNFICFSRYFLLFIFFQPCPARVAVPCPSAFAPGKFVLVHHVSRYSVISNSGTADQLALWGSPP